MVNQGSCRRPMAAVLVPLIALVLAACGSGGTTGRRSPSAPASSTSSTPATDPSIAAATQAAVAAYLGYIQEFAEAAQSADPNDPNLPRYLADPLLSLTRHNLQSMKDKGLIQVGEQKATVISSQADLISAQPTVTIHACLDYSALKLVYKSNHSPVPGSQITMPRVSAIATVWLYKSGQWLVNDTKQGSEPC